MAAWILVNVNRNSKEKPEPFSLEEVTAWLGYAGNYVRPRQPQEPEQPTAPTVEDLKHKIDVVAMLHKGLYGENGQGAAGA
jgi:hypothetical protein